MLFNNSIGESTEFPLPRKFVRTFITLKRLGFYWSGQNRGFILHNLVFVSFECSKLGLS